MKEARAVDASLVAAASLEIVSLAIRSSRTLADWAFSEGMVICMYLRISWEVSEKGIVK